MASKFNPTSFTVISLDSAIRFAWLALKESKEIRALLSQNSSVEEGRKRSIHFFRTFQRKDMGYERARPLVRSHIEEKQLISDLKELKKEISVYLARIGNKWDLEGAIEILNRIIYLEEDIMDLFNRIKSVPPDEGKYYFVGIDGGGTHSKVAISDSEGVVLGTAKTGPTFPKLLGYVKTIENVLAGIRKACNVAGLDFETVVFKKVVCGVAGISSNEDHRKLNGIFFQYIKKFHSNILDVIVIQDTLLGWFSALGGENGILVIGGTGHIVWGYKDGLNAESTQPDIIKDWHTFIHLGGRHIGYHASLRIHEILNKGKETELTRKWKGAFEKGEIFKDYSDRDFKELMSLISKSLYSKNAPIKDKDIASMAKMTFQVAKTDKDAMEIITVASKNAAIYISKVAERLGLHGKYFKVAHVGSVIGHWLAMRKLKRFLPEFEPNAELVKPLTQPWIGALEIARKNIVFY